MKSISIVTAMTNFLIVFYFNVIAIVPRFETSKSSKVNKRNLLSKPVKTKTDFDAKDEFYDL